MRGEKSKLIHGRQRILIDTTCLKGFAFLSCVKGIPVDRELPPCYTHKYMAVQRHQATCSVLQGHKLTLTLRETRLHPRIQDPRENLCVNQHAPPTKLNAQRHKQPAATSFTAYSARPPHCPLQFASGVESSKQKHFSVHKTNENTGKPALGNDFEFSFKVYG